VEHNEWMNDQVREEIEDLQQTHGFEEDEAAAFWHLRQVGKLMNEMRRADLGEDMDRFEGLDDQEMRQQVIFLDSASRWHSTVLLHYTALQRALGHRVLRRSFPEGWARSRYSGLEEED
jgi:hypothetical protein